MLKNKKKSTTKDFILSVSLGSGKREERDLTVPEKKNQAVSISPYWDSLWLDIFHKMMIKQNFKTSSNVCCFVDKVTGFGGGQVKEGKEALFLSHRNCKLEKKNGFGDCSRSPRTTWNLFYSATKRTFCSFILYLVFTRVLLTHVM